MMFSLRNRLIKDALVRIGLPTAVERKSPQ